MRRDDPFKSMRIDNEEEDICDIDRLYPKD